ncbi:MULTISPECIES: class I SAM-dependent methyltransferase [unclassified Brachybacterium]|uniref:class I SAM-dependent methyltransferase n=1 Tax=unclassified Brachybacterium TaxID=2623841 RepID=UPI003615F401
MSAVDAYSRRAQEYSDLLGSIDAMAPTDRHRIETWAAEVHGPILDAGCGPGHWTAHLASLGHDVEGLDPVPEFLDIARRAHPEVAYRAGSFGDLVHEPGRYGGVLAWYSLIHLDPVQVPETLSILHDALRPGGTLLLGFFDGPCQEAFDHAVATAQYWPAAHMAELLGCAGFDVLEVEQRQDPGVRPHAAITARRPGSQA